MDKAQRAQLLRQRFKAVGGLPFVFTGERKVKPAPRPKPNRIRIDWPQANTDARRAGVRMNQPDPKPRLALRIKHRRKSAATRIAEKAPKKLARAFAKAEELLVARGRR